MLLRFNQRQSVIQDEYILKRNKTTNKKDTNEIVMNKKKEENIKKIEIILVFN